MDGEMMANGQKSNQHFGVRQRTHDGVDHVMDKAESMRDGSREAMSRLKNKAAALNENVDGYIRKNTKKSVLIAAGIGAIIGALLAFRMKRKR